MTAQPTVPRFSLIGKTALRISRLSTTVSLVGYYLVAIGVFIYALAYVKGAQILMFIPALFLGILLYSVFEIRSVAKNVDFSLEKTREGWRIFVRAENAPNLVFRIGLKDSDGNVTYAAPETRGFSVDYPENGGEILAYYRGSFDLFRRVAKIGYVPPSAELAKSKGEAMADSHFAVKRYEAGDFVTAVSPTRTMLADYPYLKVSETSADSGRGKRPSDVRLPIRSNLPITVPDSIGRARGLEWQLAVLCAAIVSVQWESWLYSAVLATTLVLLFAVKRGFGIAKIPHWSKVGAIFACFVFMLWRAKTESDMTGPVSVFLLQILLVSLFYPDERDESFLFIFLTLFISATVSFISFQVWFLPFFLVHLFLVVRLLFETSGYFGKESTASVVKTVPTGRSFAKTLGILYAATFAFFLALPHGDGARGSMAELPKPEAATSGFGDEIVLEDLLGIKRDSGKRIVVDSPPDGLIPWFERAYWRGERFLNFSGNAWEKRPKNDFAIRNFPRTTGSGETLRIRYFEPGSMNLPLPAVPTRVTFEGVGSRGQYAAKRASDASVVRTGSPLWPSAEILASFERLPPDTETPDFKETLEPLSEQTEKLFEPYWKSIPAEVSKKPGMLATYVRDRSGFEYSVDAPAKNLESFLYDEKRGHCEYYATVLALTLRHFGYPATLVNGYHSGEYSSLANAWIVRGTNAHSWVELRGDAGAWVVLEATPGEGISPKSAFSEAWSLAVAAYDYADIQWFTYVVGYTGTSQRDFFRQAARFLPQAAAFALLGLFAYFSPRLWHAVRKWQRPGEKERLVEFLRKKTGSKFPLSRLESVDASLVEETRRAVYRDGNGDSEAVRKLRGKWAERLKKAGNLDISGERVG